VASLLALAGQVVLPPGFNFYKTASSKNGFFAFLGESQLTPDLNLALAV
jgi:hypothetical protein